MFNTRRIITIMSKILHQLEPDWNTVLMLQVPWMSLLTKYVTLVICLQEHTTFSTAFKQWFRFEPCLSIGNILQPIGKF